MAYDRDETEYTPTEDKRLFVRQHNHSIMSSKLHLQLAEITSLYDRLVSILPPDKWEDIDSLAPPLGKEVSQITYAIDRLTDSLREILDDQILKETVDVHNSRKADIFFNRILPHADELQALWLRSAAFGMPKLKINLAAVKDHTTKPETEVKETATEKADEWKTVWVETIDSFIRWAVERTDGYLDEGGDGLSEIVVPNETFDRAMKLINAKFFDPDVWYENLQRINPIVANPKKLPRDVRFRVSEIHSSLIIGNYLSSVILCRSVLEFCLAKQAPAHGISEKWSMEKLKGLGDLVNAYSAKYPAMEIDFRVVKRTGDDSVHAYVSAENVVSWPKVGVGHAFKSWDALRNVLQWLYA